MIQAHVLIQAHAHAHPAGLPAVNSAPPVMIHSHVFMHPEPHQADPRVAGSTLSWANGHHALEHRRHIPQAEDIVALGGSRQQFRADVAVQLHRGIYQRALDADANI